MDKDSAMPTFPARRTGWIVLVAMGGCFAALVGTLGQISSEMDLDYDDMKRRVAEAQARTERRIDERRTLRTRLLRQCMAERPEYVCLAMVEESVDAALPVAEQYRGVR